MERVCHVSEMSDLVNDDYEPSKQEDFGTEGN